MISLPVQNSFSLQRSVGKRALLITSGHYGSLTSATSLLTISRISRKAFFEDGTIARAVNDVTADGALYFSSAANSGNFDKWNRGNLGR